MTRLNASSPSVEVTSQPAEPPLKVVQFGTELNGRSAKLLQNQKRYPKNDSRHWLNRIFKPKNDRGEESPNYSMQIAFKGKRMSFALGTGNKEAAAAKARDIYLELLAKGAEATVAKHRPQKAPATEVATVGEWIVQAESMFASSALTFGQYARCLRSIASDILSRAKTKKRFSKAGAKAFRAEIDAASLDIFTPDSVQSWRIRFVKRAGNNPAKQRSARISCNSVLRQARSLFSPNLTRHPGTLKLPSPLPFDGAEFYPRESMRYQSKIDPATLLQSASKELRDDDREAFKVLVLALGAGLRRGEIDRLMWSQFNFKTGVINIEATEAGGLKSEDSAGEVAIDPAMAKLLQGFSKQAKGQFVIESEAVNMAAKAWGQQYRCQGVLDRVNQWLRANGVKTAKPLHTLRKEAGSLIATKAGIYAASRFLRHSDIQVTSQHYADHKERVQIDMGTLMSPAAQP